MSLRSDPTIGPENPDPVTRNQPTPNEISTSATRTPGSEQMPGNYPMSPSDSTSSGGYSASPSQTWSSKSQRGIDNPLSSSSSTKERKPNSYPANPSASNPFHSSADSSNNNNANGLITQSTDGTNLRPELDDARQGRDGGAGPGAVFTEEEEWGIEKGAGRDY